MQNPDPITALKNACTCPRGEGGLALASCPVHGTSAMARTPAAALLYQCAYVRCDYSRRDGYLALELVRSDGETFQVPMSFGSALSLWEKLDKTLETLERELPTE